MLFNLPIRMYLPAEKLRNYTVQGIISKIVPVCVCGGGGGGGVVNGGGI